MAQTLGQRMRALRHERELTLLETTTAAGISVGHLNDIEHDRALPSLRTFVRLSIALDLPVVDILRGLPPFDR